MGNKTPAPSKARECTFVEADYLHSRTTALGGTAAAALLAEHSDLDVPSGLSARWTRPVLSLVAEFCDVPTVASLSATCRDSMRVIHETRAVPLPSITAVDAAWVTDLPSFSESHDAETLGVFPESCRSLPAAPYPPFFAPVLHMAAHACAVAWPYGGGSIAVELLHPVVSAFLENLWIQETCRGSARQASSATPVVPVVGTALWSEIGGLQGACLAFAQPVGHVPPRAKLTETKSSGKGGYASTTPITWGEFGQAIQSECWAGNIPTWPSESPGSLAGQPVDPHTFFQEIFTSSKAGKASLHAPVGGVRFDFGVGCLWRREVEVDGDSLPFEWAFVSYTGCTD